jgi:HK97 family phage prohead protease
VEDHDFGGYATMANRRCTDGRTISPEAFSHQDSQRVPLVWQHMHDSPENILGHAILESRPDGGTYSYGFFNETPAGINAKALVEHGDIDQLSIFANRLKENSSKTVLHGNITEVSLVLSGANDKAKIDFVRVAHANGDVETLADEAIITSGIKLELAHAAGKTFNDVRATLNEEQEQLLMFMVSEALKNPVVHSDEDGEVVEKDDKQDPGKSKSSDEDIEHQEGAGMTTKHNVFEQDKANGSVLQHGGMAPGRTLSHSEIKTIFDDGVKLGSFKDSLLQHAEDYGITNIEQLFPDARAIDNKPEWITRRMEWVEGIINGARKLPWSKIKSLSADLTHLEARAKGYIKGDLKKEQFFSVSKRETTPKTIYKKQKLDRDDIIDITDFDVVAWLWVEMYFMLREEVARAILVGDGREVDDEDKINESNIRPIAHDDEFYTDVRTVPSNVGPSALVEAVLRARTYYKGTMPTAYMTNAVLTDMLLDKDRMGRRLYRTVAELAAELRVRDIVEVEIMEGAVRDGGEILMILVNMSDYAIGSTKGGEITKFDDFDIDYNQYKYLIETRLSGALLSPKRAQVIRRTPGTLATPTVPAFNAATGVVTIPTITGVTYWNEDTDVALSAGAQAALDPGDSVAIEARPNATYYFAHNTDVDWTFTRNA